MKVLLLKDVYKLGHAGDVKRVADGYGRNYLIPQGLATLATSGAMKNAETIRSHATARRAELNQEMGVVAGKLENVVLTIPSKAGETGKLYGSITTQMIADALKSKTGVEFDRRQIDVQPIRNLGEHRVRVRLTVDLTPEIKVIVHREGEAVSGAVQPATEATKPAEVVEDVASVAEETEESGSEETETA